MVAGLKEVAMSMPGARFAMDQIGEAAKNLSFLLVILGTIHFLIRRFLPELSNFSFIFSIVLLFIAGYALADRTEKDKWAIIIPIIIFLVWYLVYQSNTDLRFLLYFGISVALLLVIPAVITKGESAKPELLGLIPIIFFFADNMLPWLVTKFNLPVSGLLENLLQWTPWWALLGILILPTDKPALNIAKILGIMYIIFVLVAPAIPTVGYDNSLLPTPGELSDAQARVRERLPEGENPALSNLICIFSEPTDLQNCITTRQENSQLTALCEDDQRVIDRIITMEECKEEKRLELQEGFRVTGFTDPRDPTLVNFRETDFFPEVSYNARDSYPIELEIQNPQNKEIEIEVTCKFTKDEEIITGKVSLNPVKVTQTSTKTLLCTPDADLDGSYKLSFVAEIKNLQTSSVLQRAFVKEDASQKEIEEIKKLHFSKSGSTQSQGPADLARLNFAFGNPLDDPIIKGSEGLVVAANVENLGRGDIIRIRDYYLDLPGFTSSCLSGGGIEIPESSRSQRTIHLLTCPIDSLPPQFQDPEDYEFTHFIGTLVYDYQIKEDISNVRVVIQ